jgi:hypothetical protein
VLLVNVAAVAQAVKINQTTHLVAEAHLVLSHLVLLVPSTVQLRVAVPLVLAPQAVDPPTHLRLAVLFLRPNRRAASKLRQSRSSSKSRAIQLKIQ